MVDFNERGETHAFYKKQYNRAQKVRSDYDPSFTVACVRCGITCVKKELLTNELGWVRADDGWKCKKCQEVGDDRETGKVNPE